MTRYCIIGAGAAGLSAIDELTRAGHDVVCFERTDRVGGHWHTDYEALHLITSRDMTAFRDFPMPATYPHFPSRDQVRDYIVSFAVERDLMRHVRLDTSVDAVEPVQCPGRPGDLGWTVRTSDGRVTHFDAVLVANGHLWDAKIPRVSGTFDGVQVHSSHYRNPADLDGERVLVVGAGNSGCDIAVDIAQHRRRSDIVMVQGLHFQPKSYFGVPRQEVGWLQDYSPVEQDFISRLLSRVTLGDPATYGMPTSQAPTLAEGATTVNTLLMYWVQHGRVGVRPGIERFDGETVHFVDGASADYDCIVWATGFNVRLPFLPVGLLAWEREVPLRRAAGILAEGVSGLYFIGLTAPRGPQLPVYGVQSRAVARMITLRERGVDVEARIEATMDTDTRIDVVRVDWMRQLEDTELMLTALEAERSPGVERTPA